MHSERMISVGIDIGTSTLQCVFGSMTLKNLSPAFAVPRMVLEDKQVLYRAPIRFTPLLSPEMIDGEALGKMIREDYERAGMDPQKIQCGAVMITGETAKKQNAKEVTQALAGLAGDFVVATAGPELESILAGKGSGAAALSMERGKPVLNLDIGGGTTNMCLFVKGEPAATGCLHLGGRLLRFHPDGRVHSFTKEMARIAQDVEALLSVGARLPREMVLRIAGRMSEVLEEAVGLRQRSGLYGELVLGHGFPAELRAEIFTFSGGVADCIYGMAGTDLRFDDIGGLLGKSIALSRFFTDARVVRPAETQHATVIGAGAYSVAVSGSTIALENVEFPMKGLQVGKVQLTSPADIPGLSRQISHQFDLFEPPFAIGFEGIPSPSYLQIEEMAAQIAQGMGEHAPRILVMTQDMAKALGQALMRHWGNNASMVCLDGISLAHGDMIDLGVPLAGGRVLPVIVKTLAFGS